MDDLTLPCIAKQQPTTDMLEDELVVAIQNFEKTNCTLNQPPYNAFKLISKQSAY